MHLTAEAPFTIWKNPAPLLVSRQAVFPGVVRLQDATLIALFAIGQAFDATDQRMHVSRSDDGGATWSDPRPLYPGDHLAHHESETLKPLLLTDGSLLAAGYGFVRPDAMTPIVDPQTGAVAPMRNKVSRSHDGGRTWSPSVPFEVEGRPLELSGPCIQLASGAIIGAAPPFHLSGNGQEGWLIRSDDQGASWNRQSVFFAAPDGNVAPWECRLADLGSNRIAVLFWAYDAAAGQNRNNHLAISRDGGASFAPAIDTGIAGQAANLMYLGDERLLTIHCHREPPVSLTGRVLRLDTDDRVTVEAECPLLAGGSAASQANAVDQFASLSFGQPGLTNLGDGDFLASWWQVDDGQHVIKACRLKLGDGKTPA